MTVENIFHYKEQMWKTSVSGILKITFCKDFSIKLFTKKGNLHIYRADRIFFVNNHDTKLFKFLPFDYGKAELLRINSKCEVKSLFPFHRGISGT